jgi:hypothetical protein
VEAVVGLSYRALNLWLLGYPEAALLDVDRALNDARKFGQTLALMISLTVAESALVLSGNEVAAYARADELITLAQEKGAGMWRALGLANKGCALLLTGKASDAVETITSGIAACRLIGTSVWMPFYLLNLAEAQAKIRKFETASRSVAEAVAVMETTNEVLKPKSFALPAKSRSYPLNVKQRRREHTLSKRLM